MSSVLSTEHEVKEKKDEGEFEEEEDEEEQDEDEVWDPDQRVLNLGENAMIELLAVAAKRLEDPFVVKQLVPLAASTSLEVDYVPKSTSTSATPSVATLSLPRRLYQPGTNVLEPCQPTPMMKAVLDTAEDAPFGDGHETRYDPKVRNAFHIPASRIRAIRGFNLESSGERGHSLCHRTC